MLSPIAIAFLGSFGGFLNHLYTHNNSLLLPSTTTNNEIRQWAPGFLAEMFLGIGGAMVGVYLLVGNQDLPRQVVMALLGGFSGGTLLSQNAANLERQRAEAFRKITEQTLDELEAHSAAGKQAIPFEKEQLQTARGLMGKLASASSPTQVNKLERETQTILWRRS